MYRLIFLLFLHFLQRTDSLQSGKCSRNAGGLLCEGGCRAGHAELEWDPHGLGLGFQLQQPLSHRCTTGVGSDGRKVNPSILVQVQPSKGVPLGIPVCKSEFQCPSQPERMGGGGLPINAVRSSDPILPGGGGELGSCSALGQGSAEFSTGSSQVLGHRLDCRRMSRKQH